MIYAALLSNLTTYAHSGCGILYTKKCSARSWHIFVLKIKWLDAYECQWICNQKNCQFLYTRKKNTQRYISLKIQYFPLIAADIVPNLENLKLTVLVNTYS